MKALILNFILLFSATAFAQDNYSKVIYEENQCSEDLISKTSDKKGKRRKFAIRLKGINVAIGARYVGVTSEGDIATVYNDGNGPVMVADICYRDDVDKEYGQLVSNPVINISMNCQIDEITSALIVLPSKVGSLYLNFRPIYFSDSELCKEPQRSEVSEAERTQVKDLEENKDNIHSSSSVNKN